MPRCKNCIVGLLGACGDDYCRSERESLIAQAREAAKQHGHKLGEFTKVKNYAVWQARCTQCGQMITINLNPESDEPDICGDAVTVECPKSEGELGKTQQDEEDAWYTQLASESD
jgi:hypothetical protein